MTVSVGCSLSGEHWHSITWSITVRVECQTLPKLHYKVKGGVTSLSFSQTLRLYLWRQNCSNLGIGCKSNTSLIAYIHIASGMESQSRFNRGCYSQPVKMSYIKWRICSYLRRFMMRTDKLFRLYHIKFTRQYRLIPHTFCLHLSHNQMKVPENKGN